MQLLSDEAISAILLFSFGERILNCVHTTISSMFQLARFWSLSTIVADLVVRIEIRQATSIGVSVPTAMLYDPLGTSQHLFLLDSL